MTKRDMIFLSFIFVIAFILRILFLPNLSLTFGYDQARDAMVTLQIIGGDFKILGPPSSAPGLYHGVFYYYFLVIPYLIGQGNPIIAAYWTSLFNAGATFIIFFLTYLITGKKSYSFLSAFIFAVSFEATQYATWLSNPTLGVWSVPLSYLGLYLWVFKKRKLGAFIAALGMGISIQSEVFLVYHLVPFLIWLIIGRKNVSFKGLFIFILTLFLTLSSMFLVEFKFGFRGISGLFHVFAGKDAIVQSRQLGDYIILYFNQIGKSFSDSILPINAGYGGALGVFFLIYLIKRYWDSRKKRNLFSWQLFIITYILSHLSVVSVGGVSTPFLLVGIGSGICILSGIVIGMLYEKKKIVASFILLLIVSSNLLFIITENIRGQTIFAIQKDMLLSKETALISWTYEEANGQKFSINSVTSPLWINNVWAYLYSWQGKKNYGYLPEWRGRDQVGQLSDGILPQTSTDTELYFLIIEPLQGIPTLFYEATLLDEDQYSILIEEESFGELKVQKRKKISDLRGVGVN